MKDLCVYCETLLDLRRRAVKIATDLDLAPGTTTQIDSCGQHMMAMRSTAAVATLRGAAQELPEWVRGLLDNIATLELHETLHEKLQGMYAADVAAALDAANHNVICTDRGPVLMSTTGCVRRGTPARLGATGDTPWGEGGMRHGGWTAALGPGPRLCGLGFPEQFGSAQLARRFLGVLPLCGEGGVPGGGILVSRKTTRGCR